MTVLASVQQASDAAPMTWGVFLTMFGAVVLLAFALVGLAAILAALEDRTRYDDEVEDTYPVERIPAGRSWK